jgi:hypothetical protein
MTPRWARTSTLASVVIGVLGVLGVLGFATVVRAAAPADLPAAPERAPAEIPPAPVETPAAPPVVVPPAVVVPLPTIVAPPPDALVAVASQPPTRASSGVGPPLAGVVTAVVPFIVGCTLWASSTRPELERAGTYVMATGFAAAPWVSHGLQGRWKRAAVFGGASVATSTATLIAMNAKDPFNPDFVNRQRVAFGVLLTSAMFASVVGVVDSFLTSEGP